MRFIIYVAIAKVIFSHVEITRYFHVKISRFRAKAQLVFHWCLYNKIGLFFFFFFTHLLAKGTTVSHLLTLSTNAELSKLQTNNIKNLYIYKMVPYTFIVEYDWSYFFCETCKLTFSLAGRQFVVCKLAFWAYWSPEVLAMYIWMRFQGKRIVL